MPTTAGFKTYYRLTKPGIIYGNLLTTTAGFLLASRWHVTFWLLISTLFGISLVIASACVFNNVIDRDIDAHMSRTKNRALVSGAISVKSALVFASALGICGFVVLATYVNWLTTLLGVIAFVDYIIFYGIAKRRSVHGTIVGSIAGAMPPVAGYTAVTNHLDLGAVLLFFILVFWQMPHFYSIAMYRLKDYKAAGVPVLPVKKGVHHTKVQIMLYIVAFSVATLALTVFGYTGFIYAIVLLVLSLLWLRKGLKGFKATDDTLWARKMFFFSLIVIMVFSLTLSVGAVLP